MLLQREPLLSVPSLLIESESITNLKSCKSRECAMREIVADIKEEFEQFDSKKGDSYAK